VIIGIISHLYVYVQSWRGEIQKWYSELFLGYKIKKTYINRQIYVANQTIEINVLNLNVNDQRVGTCFMIYGWAGTLILLETTPISWFMMTKSDFHHYLHALSMSWPPTFITTFNGPVYGTAHLLMTTIWREKYLGMSR